jgi:hypothetical protein
MTTPNTTSLATTMLMAATRDERYALAKLKAQAVDVFGQWLVYEAPDPAGPQPRGRIALIVEGALPDIDRIVLALLNDHAQQLAADATVSAREVDQALKGLLQDEIINGADGLAHAWAQYCEEARGVW